MPIYLPDCLNIMPNDLLTGCSLSNSEYLTEIAADYPIFQEEYIPEAGSQKIVYLLILAPDQPLTLLNKKIKEIQQLKLRKLYLVIYAENGFTIFTYFKKYLEIRTLCNSEIPMPTPTMISNNGKYIHKINIFPTYRRALINISIKEVIKQLLRHWMNLARAFGNSGYLLVDVTKCLN